MLDALIEPQDGTRDEPWEREWILHHFRLAMETVRAQFQPASLSIFQRLLDGESVAQVAEACGTTPAAVYKVQQRIRERLKEQVEQQIRDEELSGPAGG